jgi:hypothetical protein
MGKTSFQQKLDDSLKPCLACLSEKIEVISDHHLPQDPPVK